MLKKKKQETNYNSVVWILDACVPQDKRRWPSLRGKVKNLKEFNLISAKDSVISATLDDISNIGKVILTANKGPDKKGDYFGVSSSKGIVKFSSDIQQQSERRKYVKIFQKMVKNETKLLGAEVTLTKTVAIYKKGNKIKNIKYTGYI